MPARILCVVAFLLIVLSAAQAGQPAATAAVETIVCRALEVHTDDELKVAAVVFHQRDEMQRSQLAALLREHAEEAVEVQAADGTWRRAHLARLKSCFGRGLLIMRAPVPIPERGEFMLRLPGK